MYMCCFMSLISFLFHCKYILISHLHQHSVTFYLCFLSIYSIKVMASLHLGQVGTRAGTEALTTWLLRALLSEDAPGKLTLQHYTGKGGQQQTRKAAGDIWVSVLDRLMCVKMCVASVGRALYCPVIHCGHSPNPR